MRYYPLAALVLATTPGLAAQSAPKDLDAAITQVLRRFDQLGAAIAW